MAGWHHWLDGCESEWTSGVGDQLIYHKEIKNIQEGKATTIVLEKLDSHMRKNEIGLLSYTCIKINPKWIKDFNVRPNLKS